MRYVLIGLVIAVAVVVSAHMVGRAIDQQVQDHVLVTRNGMTLDCERITDIAGNVFLDSCIRVP